MVTQLRARRAHDVAHDEAVLLLGEADAVGGVGASALVRGDAAALLEPPHHVTHVVPRHAQPSRLSHTVATSWRKKWTRITTRHAKSSVYAAGIAAGRAPLGARLEAQGSRRRKTGARAPGRAPGWILAPGWGGGLSQS